MRGWGLRGRDMSSLYRPWEKPELGMRFEISLFEELGGITG